jgi:hypothetical protein
MSSGCMKNDFFFVIITMTKLQLRNYDYSTRKPKQERRLAIEKAILEHGKDKVIGHFKKIQNFHKILKEDLQEIEEYADDILCLKQTIACENSYFNNKEAQEQLRKIYNMTKNYEKNMTQMRFGKATVKRNLKNAIKKINLVTSSAKSSAKSSSLTKSSTLNSHIN